MSDPFPAVPALCSLNGLKDVALSRLALGLAAAGAAGSVAHCGPMCGPFVLGQVANRLAAVPASRIHEGCRIRHGLLVPYHIGRIATYTLLGAASGAMTGRLSPLRDGLLSLAAVIFLAHGVFGFSIAAPPILPRLIKRGAAQLRGADVARSFTLGLLLGLLPCGLLYSALAVAAGTGSPVLGALGMTAFGLGTAPALMILGVLGHAASRRWHAWAALAGPAALTVNAVLLALLVAIDLVA